MRSWYDLEATVWQSKNEGHGHGVRRGHHRARRKSVLVDYQSLDHEQTGLVTQLARSWSGLRALRPPVEGHDHGHGHPHACRLSQGHHQVTGSCPRLFTRKEPRPEEALRPRCANEIFSNKCDLLA